MLARQVDSTLGPQLHELVHQLRGTAGDRQVPGNPTAGFALLYGAPGTAGATVVSL